MYTSPPSTIQLNLCCRNHVPWTVIACCSFVSGVLLLVLRFVLASENKRRDASAQETDSLDEVYVEQKDESGAVREAKVDKVGYHDESFL